MARGHPRRVNKNLSLAERDSCSRIVDQNMAWPNSAVKIAREYTTAH